MKNSIELKLNDFHRREKRHSVHLGPSAYRGAIESVDLVTHMRKLN